MATAKTGRLLPDTPLIVLPAIHVLLFSLLLEDQARIGASAAVWVDLPVSLPLVARDDLPAVAVVGILATAWWYFIGLIGWLSKNRRISRTSSALGVGLILFGCGIGGFAMISGFSQSSGQRRFSPVDVLMFLLAASLLAGALIAAASSAISVFGPRKR